MTRRKKPHQPSDTLRAIQHIAKKQPERLHPNPTDSGMVSSAEAMRGQLDEFYAHAESYARAIADHFGVQPIDVLRDLARRIV